MRFGLASFHELLRQRRIQAQRASEHRDKVVSRRVFGAFQENAHLELASRLDKANVLQQRMCIARFLRSWHTVGSSGIAWISTCDDTLVVDPNLVLRTQTKQPGLGKTP
jgi:hypothetical protein